MFNKRKIEINRPARYEPLVAMRAAMYCLHRDFEYQDYVIVGAETDDMSAHNVSAYRFKRRDEVMVNYFRPIIDKESNDYSNNNFPMLENFLAAYKRLLNTKSVNAEDITIVPFLQVQDRQHFNTLVLHSDPTGQLHVYIIEPHSNNFTWPKIHYPVGELKNIIYNALSTENVTVHNPTIGVQPFYDDKTCGAHHINFTEIISHLNPVVLTQPKAIARNLRRANLDRRNNDNEKINAVPVRVHYERPVIESNQQENKGKEKLSAAEGDLDDDIEFLGRGEEAIHDLGEIKKIENELQGALAGNIKSYEERYHQNAISEAIGYIELYKTSASKRADLSGFFKHSTRLHTAESLTGMLHIINDEYISIEAKKYHAALLLGAMHQAFGKNNSELRDSLELGLAKLLNCELEYEAIMASSGSKSRFEKSSKLFRLQLYVHDRNLGADALKNMYKFSRQIVDIDSSWSYKLGSQNYKEAMNAKREALFRGLNTQMHRNFRV